MGNYFKRVHFLGKVVSTENALKDGFNEFKLIKKLHKNVAKRFFFNMNKLNIKIKAHFNSLISFEKGRIMRPKMTERFPRK